MPQIHRFETLAKALAPTVQLHPEDKYRPCSVDWYLSRVSLWLDDNLLLAVGEVHPESLLDAQHAHLESKLSLRVEPVPPSSEGYDEINPENPTYLGQGADAPCYYMVRETTSGHLALQYFFFYAYNGGMLPNTFNKLGFEAHEGDWEHITVLLDWNENQQAATLYAVAYSGHGYTTHWQSFDNPKPQPVSQLRPLEVYSAWHSHASYATPGKHELLRVPSLVRGLLGGYDETEDGGPTWVTANNLVEIRPITGGGAAEPEHLWAGYLGAWGTDVTVSPLLRTEGPTGPVTKAFDINDMGTVDVFYEPQEGQSFRCSDNFPSWDVPDGGYLNVKVDTEGSTGTPVFTFAHDKVGTDTIWYTDKKGGDSFQPGSENGESGEHAIYLATTSPLPPNANGTDTYKVTVTWTSSPDPLYPRKPSSVPENATAMSSVEVSYEPRDGQTFRCSPNFDTWDPGKHDILFFQVDLGSGRSTYPVFSVAHDKSGSDTTWYKNVTDGSCFSPLQQNGEAGTHAIYLATTSDLPAGVSGADTYTVTVWTYEG